IVDNTRVLGWESGPDGVTVQTSNGTFAGDRLIVAPGAWAGKLLPDLELPLEPIRKPVMWFDVDNRETHGSGMFPAFIAHMAQDNFYGLPGHGDDTIKIGDHSDHNIVDPDDFDREVHPADMSPRFEAFLSAHLPGVRHTLNNSAMCMYTMTPDEDFIIDRHPGDDRVAIAAGFSGHGYKFAPVIGELLADLATDESANTLQHFRIDRFSKVTSQGD
ncbi:MAG TPA: FAD-dependent oxidoreductase, partial [Thermomicrobiales bacterium]|nr:FAD-dependent oxidoreductase [Thermomicrobiales bacterium]